MWWTLCIFRHPVAAGLLCVLFCFSSAHPHKMLELLLEWANKCLLALFKNKRKQRLYCVSIRTLEMNRLCWRRNNRGRVASCLRAFLKLCFIRWVFVLTFTPGNSLSMSLPPPGTPDVFQGLHRDSSCLFTRGSRLWGYSVLYHFLWETFWKLFDFFHKTLCFFSLCLFLAVQYRSLHHSRHVIFAHRDFCEMQ